jgi:hypothetical protein
MKFSLRFDGKVNINDSNFRNTLVHELRSDSKHLKAVTFEPPIKDEIWDCLEVSEASLNTTEVPLKERNVVASFDLKKADVRRFG